MSTGSAGGGIRIPRYSPGQDVATYLTQMVPQVDRALQHIALHLAQVTVKAPVAPPPQGGVWANGGLLCVAQPTGLSALPTTAPATGSGLFWNNGGKLCIA